MDENADSTRDSPRQSGPRNCGKNASERVQLATAAWQLVIREDQRKRNNRWRCVWTSGGVSCVMTITKSALHPREHAKTLDIVGDRVHEQSALFPRIVPLRVHEGGVHAPAQQLLGEQDAAGELRWIAPTGLCGQPIGDCCAVFSIALHHSSVFFFFFHNSCEKKREIPGNNLVQLPGLVGNNCKKKRWLVIIMAGMKCGCLLQCLLLG